MALIETVRDNLQKPRLITSKITVNAVDMASVIGEWEGVDDPVMMFSGRRDTSIFLDFYNSQQGNYDVFVAGMSGSGKSVIMNEVVSVCRGIGARVWVIDMGRSYQNLIRLQKGAFLELTPSMKLCINPFTWVGTDDKLDFEARIWVFKPMIGHTASPNAPLTELQYALIGEVTTAVWQDYGQDTNPTCIRDYLLSNVKDGLGSTERVAYGLAKQLTPFTRDGVYGGFFNGRVSVSLDVDVVGLELEESKNAPELRRVVPFVLASRIVHGIHLTRDRKKSYLVDETWQLPGADRETAESTEEGYCHARKYNGTFCVGAQGVEDAYKNDAAQAAYSDTDWKTLLCQDRRNLEKLIEDGMVNLPPVVKQMSLSLHIGHDRLNEMFTSPPNDDSVMRHVPDPFSLLIASANVQDFNECNALLEQGHPMMEALEIMLTRRALQEQLSSRRREDDY